MFQNSRKESLKWIAVLLVLFVILWVCENVREQYEVNYHEDDYKKYEILETKAEALGNTYLNYTAEEGCTLYQLEHLIQNKGIQNIEYLYLSYDFECDIIESPETGEKRIDYDSERYRYRARYYEVLPAGQIAKKINIVEVPEELKEISIYETEGSTSEEKETVISLK